MRVSIVTVSFEEGDAIGNYICTLADVLGEIGFSVEIYAENTPGVRGYPHIHPSYYRPRGDGILWYHYSIFSESMHCFKNSNDHKIVDFHGVSPPWLFKGHNSYLEDLCRRGEDSFKQLSGDADLCIVHSDYSRRIALRNGYSKVEKVPLVVDTRHLGVDDAELSQLLSSIDYLLFVGRVVPQKSVIDLVKAFHQFKQYRPQAKLFLVGNCQISPSYVRQVEDLIRRLGLEDDVVFTGKVTNPMVLSSLYKHAKFTMCLSEWESFCVPIVESMFFGIPVVGNALEPIPEIAGGAGVIVNKDHHAATARMMHEILQDGEMYRRLKTACLIRSRMFTRQQLKLELVDLLRREFA